VQHGSAPTPAAIAAALTGTLTRKQVRLTLGDNVLHTSAITGLFA
jgi:hypothetical protein